MRNSNIYKNIFMMMIVFTLTFVSVSSIVFAEDTLVEEDLEKPKPVRGKVIEMVSEETAEEGFFGDNSTTIIQNVKVEILTGDHKGEILHVENMIDDMLAYNINVEEGDKVLLYLEQDTEGNIINGYISDIARDKYLVYLGIFFVLLLIIVGGMKGIKSIITLGLTILAVFKILLPMILKGYNATAISILICIGVTTITLMIISGINQKTFSAIIGTTGGVLVAGIITWIMSNVANLTGLGSEEAQMLMFIPGAENFNFEGILFSGIILGALGAVMDVSMSIASSLNELKITNPDIDKKSLIKSGMNIGKDIMGTMSNTLILAYTGGALHMMLLFMAHDFYFTEIINRDMIASEVVRALAGSIGLIFTIPITAFVASIFIKE
ncbi:YibE/F family protein [Clostridiisalibacter paucivorans]|uniref:YibE/F family protein n=1 Tax=Clostridiisalibacter paucivorans TaxID=408753 RepID=UPI000A9BE5B7|nr:YibE/F family protein [Clostridiisalibacter paucivorans]